MGLHFNLGLPLVLVVATACSPTASKLESFGKASDATVSLLSIPGELSTSALQEAEVNRNYCSYVRYGAIRLGESPAQKPSKLILDQYAVAKGLQAYSKALAGALDAEAEKELREAGGGLADQAGELVVDLGGSAEVSKTLGFLAQAALRLDAERRLSSIKAEMENVLPLLIRLEELVREDADRVDAELKRHVATWESTAKCVLKNLHRNDPETRAIFAEFDARKRQLETDRKRARKAADALEVLQDAHVRVITDEGTLDEGIEILDSFLAELQEIKDA